MNFPPDFQFNQGNLQNFVDCRRRFYLRSIRQLAWPAVASEPMMENERLSQQGAAFHRLAQQFFLGIPTEKLQAQARDETIQAWLDHFLEAGMQLPGIGEAEARWLPEINLTSQEMGFRMVAKFDLLVILPDGRFYIYDWKTSRSRTRPHTLAEKMQTRLYRYLLSKVAPRFTGKPVQPEQISMIYWFANFPAQPEIIPYTAEQVAADEQILRQTIRTIQDLVARDVPEKPGEGFPLTLQEKRCDFCMYRSLCARGVRAGMLTETTTENAELPEGELDDSEVDFSLDQIAEIEF